MSKKYNAIPKSTHNHPNKLASEQQNHQMIIPVIFIALYLLLDFIPEFGALDVAGPQWIYFCIMNGISTVYIFYYSKQHGYGQKIKRILSIKLTQIYIFLFALAGLSIFFAINQTESWVCYAGLINTTIAFFNIAILLSGRMNSFKLITQLVSAIVLIQALSTLAAFFDGINHIPLGEVISSLKGNTGNKNTLATSLVVKLAFVMYGIYASKSWTKFIHVPVLILGTIAVFILSTRSAYMGLFLQLGILLVFGILQSLKARKHKEVLTQIGPILLSVVFAFFIAQAILINVGKSQASKNTLSSVTERISSIASSTNSSNARRLELWESSIDYIKKHPFMGAGYGNCKLAIIPYEDRFQIDFNYGKHLHNDFLETAMELGILGGLAFFSLFVCALIYTIKIWKSQAHDPLKNIAIFSLIALAGYFTDAVFNFPSERPIMQVFFALILAINGCTFLINKDEKINPIPVNKNWLSAIFALITVGLLGIATYYKYFTYQSLVIQSVIAQDDFPNTANHSWKEINDQLPEIPNLAVLANSPIDVIKAWYLSRGGKYDEAMVLLNKSTKVNPYNMANEYVKAQVFYQTGKLDSAFYYARKGFYTRPANIGYYGLFTDIAKSMKDTMAIKNAFKTCVKYRGDVPNVWNKYINVLLSLNYNKDYLLAIAYSAEKRFPTDKTILKNKFIINATLASNSGYIKTLLSNSLKIIELDPTDYAYIENVGACYFMLKQYDLALPYLDKVISAKTFTNGKSEYIKGLCLINLGKKEEACFYLKIADARNFLGAQKLVSTYCK